MAGHRHTQSWEASSLSTQLSNGKASKIACLEEIALANGWLTRELVKIKGMTLSSSSYGQYLLELVRDTV